MTHNSLLTRYSKENEVNLLEMGSRRTRTADAMRRKRREGWLQYCPLSYDQAHCIHPPFVERYAIQAFLSHVILTLSWCLSTISGHDEKSLHRYTILSFSSSKSSFWLQLGLLEIPQDSHPETEAERCLRLNQRRVARTAWVWCEPSTSRRDPRTDHVGKWTARTKLARRNRRLARSQK